VRRRIGPGNRAVSAPPDDFPSQDQNRPDGDFSLFSGHPGFSKGNAHESRLFAVQRPKIDGRLSVFLPGGGITWRKGTVWVTNPFEKIHFLYIMFPPFVKAPSNCGFRIADFGFGNLFMFFFQSALRNRQSAIHQFPCPNPFFLLALLLMNRPKNIPEIALIADDLTGSLDTGLQFRKKGLFTIVPIHWNQPLPKAQALVINTDSRNIRGDVAYRIVYRICRRLRAGGIYKKIDSTMRGNVGKEALAILSAQKIAQAVVVPTVPVMGRAVEGGILRVHGTPLLKTAYARDPFHPLWTSRVSSLLEKETGERVGFIGIKEVRRGAPHLAQRIQETPARLLSLDAVLQSDLKIIAQACNLLSGQVLPCGSVGLAEELNLTFRRSSGKRKKRESRRPLLIISASRNPTTANQIVMARNHSRFPLVEPDLGRLTNPRTSGSEARAAAQKLAGVLAKRDGAILTTTFQKHLAGKETMIPRILGKAAVHLLGKVRLGGLVLTGGDLAMGVCEQLSSSALRIEEEVLPGIPCSTLTDGPFKGLRMVTKAGGFGEKDALWRILRYLRGENAPKNP
jgi:uncharacterized protein YgbK (DUF1537 family)